VKLVYRDFPLPNHPEARPAAEAALCAHDQGKFWDFHDRIFQNQGSLSAATYKQIAADLNLDASAFGQCLDSGKHRESIQADVKEGESMGVTGTPAFFINGRFLSGAQPFEAFKAIIDDELSN
jgi:protein-disulfide isomerase